MANIKKSVTEILEIEGQNVKPYEVYRIWQEAILEIDPAREADPTRALRPQMAYNYDRNGLIVKGRASKNESTAGRYTVQEAVEFVSRWIRKNYNIQWPAVQQAIEVETEEVEGQLDMFEIDA